MLRAFQQALLIVRARTPEAQQLQHVLFSTRLQQQQQAQTFSSWGSIAQQQQAQHVLTDSIQPHDPVQHASGWFSAHSRAYSSTSASRSAAGSSSSNHPSTEQHMASNQRQSKHFSSSSSSKQLQPAEAAAPEAAAAAAGASSLPAQAYKQPMFWNQLSSKIRSRKPAVKYPARHQWHYCAPDYDPMTPVPDQPLPPYAPLRAHLKNYKKIYAETRPVHNRKSYKRLWQKNLAVADQRWRQTWEKKLAAERKAEEIVKQLSDRIIRQRSWEMWQLQKQRQAL